MDISENEKVGKKICDTRFEPMTSEFLGAWHFPSLKPQQPTQTNLYFFLPHNESITKMQKSGMTVLSSLTSSLLPSLCNSASPLFRDAA